ncbi:MAG: Maf family protein [Terracidiphilus sp.]
MAGRGFTRLQALNKSKWASRHTNGTRGACHNSIMLVLASASPRRSELLTQASYRFRVHPAHIPEDPLPGEDPITYVTRLAREKAEAVFSRADRRRLS